MMTAAIKDWLVLDVAAPSTGDPLTEFLAGTAEGRLVMPFCGNGHPLDFDQIGCERDDCTATDRRWRDVRPTATVLASIVMHRIERAFVTTGSPYPVTEVEFDSGHRLYLSTDRNPGAVAYAPGDTVEIAFVRVGQVHIPRIQVQEKKE
jgi:uncharacterized OB-fold protein